MWSCFAFCLRRSSFSFTLIWISGIRKRSLPWSKGFRWHFSITAIQVWNFSSWLPDGWWPDPFTRGTYREKKLRSLWLPLPDRGKNCFGKPCISSPAMHMQSCRFISRHAHWHRSSVWWQTGFWTWNISFTDFRPCFSCRG